MIKEDIIGKSSLSITNPIVAIPQGIYNQTEIKRFYEK